MKSLRKKLRARLASIPEREIEPGLYVMSIGRRYVHMVDTWDRTTCVRMELKEFVDWYFPELLKD